MLIQIAVSEIYESLVTKLKQQLHLKSNIKQKQKLKNQKSF